MLNTAVAYNCSCVPEAMILSLHKQHVHVVYPQLIDKATDCRINSIKVTHSQSISYFVVLLLLC